MDVDKTGSELPDAPAVCLRCGVASIEPGHEAPLCAPCRTLLARRPFPVWLQLSSIALVGLSIVAGVRSVSSFHTGIAFERGKKAERRENFDVAVGYYEKVVKRFPDSALARVRLAVSQAYSGHLGDFDRSLNKLRGREMSRELAEEVTEAIRVLEMRERFKDNR